MMRNLLIVLGLLLCFAVGGVGIFRYLSSRGGTPFLKASSADLAGSWKNQVMTLKIESNGEALKVDNAEFLRDGKAPRWVEKSPQGQIPRVLEWDGSKILMTTTNDSGQRHSQTLQRVR